MGCDGDVSNECFDFDCPESHPVRMPEIHLYVRVLNYEGGAHVFSNDTDIFHSDYFSGWDDELLQYVLDECENYSEAANPDAFCSDFLTFRKCNLTRLTSKEQSVRKMSPVFPSCRGASALALSLTVSNKAGFFICVLNTHIPAYFLQKGEK